LREGNRWILSLTA